MAQLPVLVISTFGVWLLALLALFLFREYRVDRFRQRIFEVRDELFDYAAEGKISFDDPAYGALRGLLNSYIRFAHRLSLTRTVSMLLLRRCVPNPVLERSVSELLRPINELPAGEVRDRLRDIQSRASSEIFGFVAWPLVMLMMPPLLAVLAGSSLYRLFARKRDEITQTIEVEAIESGFAEMRELDMGHLQPA